MTTMDVAREWSIGWWEAHRMVASVHRELEMHDPSIDPQSADYLAMCILLRVARDKREQT